MLTTKSFKHYKVNFFQILAVNNQDVTASMQEDVATLLKVILNFKSNKKYLFNLRLYPDVWF